MPADDEAGGDEDEGVLRAEFTAGSKPQQKAQCCDAGAIGDDADGGEREELSQNCGEAPEDDDDLELQVVTWHKE